MAGQSSGQCGPCVYGLPAIADDMIRLGSRRGRRPICWTGCGRRLSAVNGRGACRHPDGAGESGAQRAGRVRSRRHGPTPVACPVPYWNAPSRCGSRPSAEQHEHGVRILIDPVACDAYGYCAELLPEAITLDEWGYPVVDGKPIPPELVAAHAELHATALGGPSRCVNVRAVVDRVGQQWRRCPWCSEANATIRADPQGCRRRLAPDRRAPGREALFRACRLPRAATSPSTDRPSTRSRKAPVPCSWPSWATRSWGSANSSCSVTCIGVAASAPRSSRCTCTPTTGATASARPWWLRRSSGPGRSAVTASS